MYTKNPFDSGVTEDMLVSVDYYFFVVALVALLTAMCGLYVYCCRCSMRGELDLQYDQETKKPFSRMGFKWCP